MKQRQGFERNVIGIKKALNCFESEKQERAGAFDRASVAMILSEGSNDYEVCFIKRASRVGDPWSGQVAFPGGRANKDDPSVRFIAERETKEEIAIELRHRDYLGRLPSVDASNNLSKRSLELFSFVYFIDGRRRADAVADPKEVDSIFWVPIERLFESAEIIEFEYPLGKKSSKYSGIRYDNYIIWGLTQRIIRNFDAALKNAP